MRVAVIGAGVMGAGVAQVAALGGHEVVLLDISEAALAGAERNLRRNVRAARLLNMAGPSPKEILERIAFTTDWQQLAGCAFVIENVTEQFEVKRSVFRQLEEVCNAGCIFAANTSAIPITRIAAVSARPDRVIGTHFMNPPPAKQYVEVIRGDQTSDATLTFTLDLLRQMGKEAILVGDGPGFVSNRVLMLTINEAIRVVEDGIAGTAAVDDIFTKCFSHAMGPLRTADLIGLDTIVHSLLVLQEAFNDSKFLPCALLVEMVQAGRLGRKSGKGFYDYELASSQETR